MEGGNADFYKWFIEWYRPISKTISIAFSIPNELTDSIVSKDAIVLDVFSKIDQSVNAKELLKEITEKADKLGVSIYLLPTPIHHNLSDGYNDKITKDYLIDYYAKFGFETINDGWMERKVKYQKGGITGDVDYLTDNLLMQKIKIFLEKVSPLKFYYLDEKTNKLYVGFDESFTQNAAEKFYKEATSSVEFFDADSVDMEFFPKTGDTIYSILIKKPVKFDKGGVTFADKVKAVKKTLLKRKKVAPKVQKDYGKTYSPKEALHSAKRIVGAMKKKWESKNK